jgi:hypothetical protein
MKRPNQISRLFYAQTNNSDKTTNNLATVVVKRRTKIVLTVGGAFFIGYAATYAACRAQRELIHRKTWDNGWNRHWIRPANPEPSVQPHPLAPQHIPGDEEYNVAMQQFKREWKAISLRRKVFGVVYFPLRCCESVIWWILDARHNPGQKMPAQRLDAASTG